MTQFYKPLVALVVLTLSFVHSAVAQQININNSYSASQLVENNLVVGCVEISNIVSTVNGSVNGFNSFAYFENGNSNFPFKNGIMLSTGNPMSGGNTLNNDILNEGNDQWLTDADLEEALGISGTINATSIEFDFVSITNQLQFNYILASEEYFGNFPCQYSDGFAFLIKETGTSNPYQNIALIPGGETPVNTNTIHDEIVGYCEASNENYFEGYNLGDTNYNGRTKVMTATATIEPYIQYTIKLVIADQTDQNYDSAVFIEGNSFDAEVNLGEDVMTCASEVALEGNIFNPQAIYSWYLNDVLIAGETTPELNAIASGNYRIKVEIPLAGSTCIIEDSVAITLSSTQSADAISDFQLCDGNADGLEIFDLSTKYNETLNAVPESNYSISYHYSNADALNSNNPITTPIENTSNPQTVFVRIEDDVNGCLAYSQFDLVVNSIPEVTAPAILIACAEVADNGAAIINLSEKDDEITNNNLDLSVTYYLNLTDAENGENAIPLPYVNNNGNEQVFARVTNTTTGCANTTNLRIEVINKPVINMGDHMIDACDSDHDGFAQFDLTEIIPDVLEGLTGVNVSFHETLLDAENGINPILNETAYPNPQANEGLVYIRVVDDETGCASITAIEIHTNLLLTGTNIEDFSQCDIGNDGTETFDLEDIALKIINGLEEVSIEFFLNEDDRNNGRNAIDTSVGFVPSSNPQVLYLTLTNPTCSEVAEIELIVNPIVQAAFIGSQVICDEDQDGFTSLNLNQFNNIITEDQSGFNVKYYLTEEDAHNNTGAVPSSYVNTTNPQTFYYRARLNATGCADVKGFEITVLEAPISAVPEEVIICDDDQDGFSIVDLDAKISEVIDNATNRNVTFHTSTTDAENDVHAITNTSSFSARTQTITIRIENATTGCYSLQNLEIIVNTLPIITDINVFKFCEEGDDGFGEFVFKSQDANILDGQNGKRVKYYESAQDAEDDTAAINKNQPYVNLTNPQTIYIRVENITDTSCYGTSSFPIKVGTNPPFNEATDIFVCDDMTNDGSVRFDLGIQLAEITDGFPEIKEVTFHASALGAENNENPLPLNFENTVNPQQIYARINNGSICESYTSFVLNVIAAPDTNLPDGLTQCDVNYDGFSIFDLTGSEVDILDVRQDDIVIAYYLSEEDAALETNEITNPSNFSNTTNPQTVFVKVSNSISNCSVNVPLELTVDLPPAIHFIEEYQICNTADGFTDLTEINDVLLKQTENVVVTYFSSEADARDQKNTLDNYYKYQTTRDALFVRVAFSTTGCFYVHNFDLIVNPLPTANQPVDMEDCDDDYDGFQIFNVTQQDAEVLGGQNPNKYSVTYYTDLVLAEEGVANISSNFEGMDKDIIYVRVENKSTGCFALTQFAVAVHPKPIVEIEDQVICLDYGPLTVSANTNDSGDSYLWSTNASTPEIEITTVGTYSVTVTSEFGCVTSRVFEVNKSESANIEFTEVIDFSDPNNVTVTISGIGNYLYQIDENEPQESNVFQNVPLGYHILTIIDLNGCSEVTKEIVVIDAPKFMTPNGDGYFDTWHISGVETLPGTIIYIYDRYGKLMTQLTSSTPGWDGRFNGQQMPASDYWFVANVKKDNIAFEVKGHFSVRR